MELKLSSASKSLTIKFVLIVPLWNWNAGKKEISIRTLEGSNRTFMELKFAAPVDTSDKTEF